MIIQHNISAMFTQRQLGITDGVKGKSSEKLSSGYRINRAADDAAGLAMSEKMRRQIRGLTQASSNAQDGVSMVQTAEGALNEVHDMLQRMSELCIKASNDTLSYEDRAYIQQEIGQINKEFDRVGTTTRFNDIKLFDGLLQPDATAVTPAAEINGSSGTVTQATYDKDATLRIDPIEVGDVLHVPAAGTKPEKYYKGATLQEILDYEQEWRDYNDAKQAYDADMIAYEEAKRIYDADPTAEGAVEPTMPTEPTEPLKRDGSSSEKAELTEIDEMYSLFANSIIAYNMGANEDVATSMSVSWSSGDKGLFNLHFYGPMNVTLQVGADQGNTYTFTIEPVNAVALGVHDVDVKGFDGSSARSSIDKVKSAIEENSRNRSNLGAVQNRLEHMIRNLDNVVENTTAAESRIRDTDMASEMQRFSNTNILAQAGQTILAQANQTNQGVLSLLQ